ncbi:MAG: hypothetical protein ACRCYP_03690 [Alphaproteobacteria bacterium]
MRLALLSIGFGSVFVGTAAIASPAPVPPETPIQSPQPIQPGASYSNSSTDLSNNGTVEQSNSLQQSQYGSTMSNVQVNNQNDSYYGFGQGIAAPVPTINVSTWGGTDFNGYGTFGGTATVSIPLGGRVGKIHKRYVLALTEAAEENAKQKKLQTEMERAKNCAELAHKGVEIARLTFCQDIMMAAKTEMTPAPQPQIQPPPPPPQSLLNPQVPVPALW